MPSKFPAFYKYLIKETNLTQSLWTQKGESLSHKNACKEFGLKESDIINAIRDDKLQYKINYAHGNPYYKVLRREVKALAVELHGINHFKKQEVEYQIKKITKEINSCKRKLKVLEKEKELQLEKLTQLENQQKQ